MSTSWYYGRFWSEVVERQQSVLSSGGLFFRPIWRKPLPNRDSFIPHGNQESYSSADFRLWVFTSRLQTLFLVCCLGHRHGQRYQAPAPRPQPQLAWPLYEPSAEGGIRGDPPIVQMEFIKNSFSYLARLEWTERVQHDCKFCDRSNFASIVYEVSLSIWFFEQEQKIWPLIIYRMTI
jgi:hypothetical protein